MSGWRRDLNVAVRALSRRPTLVVAVVATLALGIGANAAMLAIANHLLYGGPAGVADPQHVGALFVTRVWPSGETTTENTVSYPRYLELHDNAGPIESVAAIGHLQLPLGRGEGAVQVRVGLATPTFFRVLGLTPARGRFFAPSEDRIPEGEPVAVLNHALWTQRFGANPKVLGHQIVLRGRPFTIVGIASADFRGLGLDPIDLWIPLSAGASNISGPRWYADQHASWLQVIARIRRGSTLRQGAVAAAIVTGTQATSGQGASPAERLSLLPLTGIRGSNGELIPQARISGWLLGISAILLIISCANVANLMLFRMIQRRHEIAIRVAVGAGRWHLTREVLAEISLLVTLSAGAALLVARWIGALTRGLLLPDGMSPAVPAEHLVGPMIAVAIVAGALVSLIPLAQVLLGQPGNLLRSGVAVDAPGISRLRGALAVTQTSLSVVLLVCAGLFVRSLASARRIELGFSAPNVLIATMRFDTFDNARLARTLDEARARLRETPGIASTSLSVTAPFSWSLGFPIRIPGRDSLPGAEMPYGNGVTGDFFRTLGIRIVSGRPFTEDDRLGSARVAIINETMARAYWPGGNPVGACIEVRSDTSCTEIVGVVADIRQSDLRGTMPMQFYLPLSQRPDLFSAAMMEIRTGGGATAAVPLVRRALSAAAPNALSVEVQSLESLITPQVQPWRLGAALFSMLGGLAMVVAAIGLYGVLSYSIAQRWREIAVRLTLGARPRDVRLLLVAQGVRLVGVGLALGVAIALALGRYLAPLLFNTSPHDGASFGGAVLVLVIAAAGAIAGPIRRAGRVAPASILRVE